MTTHKLSMPGRFLLFLTGIAVAPTVSAQEPVPGEMGVPGVYGDSVFCEHAHRNVRAAPPGSRDWRPGIWALSSCPDAIETIALLWERVPADSMALLELGSVSQRRVRNIRMLDILTRLARDPGRPRQVRLAAVGVLASFADSTISMEFVGSYLDRPSSQWGVGTIGPHHAPRTAPGALPPDVRATVAEVIFDLAISDPDTLFGRHLEGLVQRFDPDRGMALFSCRSAQRTARALPPESAPWQRAMETLETCPPRYRIQSP